MTTEIDMEGKDQMVYGDVFSGGHPVEITIPNPVNSELKRATAPTPQPPAQPPLETIEK